MSWTLVSYIFKAAVRDRIILSFAFIMILSLSLSLFLGSAAVTEKSQFTLVFTAASMRIAGMLGLVLFVVFHIRRSFETKDIEYLLSRPLSRVQYMLSHSAAFSIIALIVSLLTGLIIAAFSGHVGTGQLMWTVSLAAEYVIMANAAMFFAMVLASTPASALITIALYVLGRLIGQILGIAESSLARGVYDILAEIMKIISIIIPRLDLMGQTSWLIYGDAQWIWLAITIGHGLIFAFLVVTASIVDLVRRQF